MNAKHCDQLNNAFASFFMYSTVQYYNNMHCNQIMPGIYQLTSKIAFGQFSKHPIIRKEKEQIKQRPVKNLNFMQETNCYTLPSPKAPLGTNPVISLP